MTENHAHQPHFLPSVGPFLKGLSAVFIFASLSINAHADPLAADSVIETDSVATSDTIITRSLQDIEVRAIHSSPLRMREGKYVVMANQIQSSPSLLGNPDPLRILQTFSEVRTSGEVTPGISVAGMNYSNNYISINDAEVLNPYHLLGLFSTLNPTHFANTTFESIPTEPSSPNILGAYINSQTQPTVEDDLYGRLSVGLINANGTLKIPANDNMFVLSGRYSYLDKIFPDLLRYEHSSILYSFNDLNATFIHQFGSRRRLTADLFFSSDNMRLTDRLYDMDGEFGWTNILGSVRYDSPDQDHRLSFSRTANKFKLRESSFNLSVPSSLWEGVYDSTMRFGHLTTGINLTLRGTDEQGDHEGPTEYAFDGSLSAQYLHQIVKSLSLIFGAKATYFNGDEWSRLYLLPSINLDLSISEEIGIEVGANRKAQFTHLVKESSTGLPVNYFINASKRFNPQEAWNSFIRLSGQLFGSTIGYNVSGYFRWLYNQTEFGGSALNLINSGYNPLTDLYSGRGRAYGININLGGIFGRFQGQVSYALGRSEIRIPAIREGYFPSSSDRRHDLKVSLIYTPIPKFSIGMNTYAASGTPYTEAAYGYMIGENLICQYYPHNSSRLPWYFRVDLGMKWRLKSSRRLIHIIELSAYNLSAHDNVIMKNYTYSPESGIKSSTYSFKNIIPSISYTLLLQ